jgi:hypothetical protein
VRKLRFIVTIELEIPPKDPPYEEDDSVLKGIVNSTPFLIL